MIRVFFATQPGVLSLIGMEPDSYLFDFKGHHQGRDFYLATRGKGWVLFRPGIMRLSAHDGLSRAAEPETGPLGAPS
jgi:hypothetical protein